MRKISKWSQSYLFTLREAPADAEIKSHQLLVRAGMIKKVAPGIYTYGQFALRALRKFENIIREELENRDCIEVLMPMVHPKELWDETNRWSEMGDGLLKFKNRNGHDFCLGATHEEVVTDYVRRDIKSYRDLPKTLYQIQDKYRDEVRPRFGLMRGREFFMKDAYSFDANEEEAIKSYDKLYEAYQAIFNRLGLNYRVVEADAGNIGGNKTHEFQVLADAGEDHLMVCTKCDYAANIEIAPALDATMVSALSEEISKGSEQKKSSAMPETMQKAMPERNSDKLSETKIEKKLKEEFPTPGLKSIQTLAKSLGVPGQSLVKTLFFSTLDGSQPEADIFKSSVCVIVRGEDEVNPVKLKKVLGLANPPLLLTDEEVKKVSGAWPGSCGPVGLTIPVVADLGLRNFSNFVTGANKDAVHIKNVNFDDFKVQSWADIRMTKIGDLCPQCQAPLTSYRGIEVGHVFYLGTKYSKMMNATFLDQGGKEQFIEMGCYGIGVGRSVQSAVEQSHDADGIIWPASVAPYHVHIALLDPKDESILKFSEELSKNLSVNGMDVFIDDRDERPGVKFKDADLLGLPMRIVVGKRGLDSQEVEVVERKTKQKTLVQTSQIVSFMSDWFKGQVL